MIQRRTRDYEVSLWTLQDSPIAILKPYGLEYKGQIQEGKLQDKDDGTQTFSFTIPMYIIKNGKRIENPCWYNVLQGHLLANLRKIKVIFNKNYEDGEERKIYEFLIVKATENHNLENNLFCDVECEGLAFHELGKLGYKISLTAEDFYNDDYDWSVEGKWITGKGKLETEQPLATLNYWNDKVFGTTNNWDYEIQMDWSSYSLWEYTVPGNLTDTTVLNDLRSVITSRLSNRVYEDDFVDSWGTDLNGNIIPLHVTGAREKARVSLDIHDSNIYNITQSLAETFGVFCKYVYEHDENLRITRKKVIYYNNFLKESEGVMDITYPYQISSVKRVIDSSDIVTKLFVKQILDDNSSNGLLNIMDVGANKSKEDYILNFDYLYKSGGITQEQYDAIDVYIKNIRRVNEDIAPYSAKVISLESQLIKLLAELTTVTNAIAKATEELAMGQLLLNAITNGNEVLQVTENNPQSVVLMKDSGKDNNSYYIKLTQKGIYPETIHMYKKYSYVTAKLDENSLITTGKVEFDEFGNVNKISNIYYAEGDPKTIYIIYSYRPKMYYESIVLMWSARLAKDTARKAELNIEIAKINYNLYGKNSKYSMKGIDLSDIKDINIKGKFKNLILKKNNLIKEFNALMGPALRLGYWQPEEYTDYGDQYNDSFNISLNNSKMVDGTTGNSYFLWDEELFDNEQKLYYEYTAEQTKIPYPCIDLTTPHGKQILQLIVNNDMLPISFVFKPVTALADNPYPTAKPNISHPFASNNEVYVIPNLYTWDNIKGNHGKIQYSNEFQIKINEGKIPSYYYQQFNLTTGNYDYKYLYNGLLNSIIDPGFKSGFTSFYWQYKAPNEENWSSASKWTGEAPNIRMSNITNNNNELLSFARLNHLIEYNLNDINSYTEDRPYLQLLSTSQNSLNNYSFRLLANNIKGSSFVTAKSGEIVLLSTNPIIVKTLTRNLISLPLHVKLNQHKKRNDISEYFSCTYNISNNTDITYNHYQWIITTSSNHLTQILAEYFAPDLNIQYLEMFQDYAQVEISNDNKTHTLKIYNGNYNNSTFFLEKLPDNLSWLIQLIVRNLVDYLNDTETVGTSYSCLGASALPWVDKTLTMQEFENTKSIQFNIKKSFDINLYVAMASIEDNKNLLSEWAINGGTNGQWIDINTWINNNNNTVFSSFSVSPILDNLTSTTNLVTAELTINDGKSDEAINILSGKTIRARVKNDKGWSAWYDQFTGFNITNPITINSAWTTNDANILLSLQTQNISFTIEAENATQYKWTLKDSNNNLIGNNNIVTASNPQINIDNRYIINYLLNGKSRLTIVIPDINDNNKFRDNGTKIKCLCNNASNVPRYFPGDNLLDWTVLSVNYPVRIISPETYLTDWWPLENVQKDLPQIQFKIPVMMAEKFNNNEINEAGTRDNFNIIININKIINTDTNEIMTNIVSNELFEFRNTISSIERQNNLLMFTCIPKLLLFTGKILNIKDANNNSIVDFDSTTKDRQYSLSGTITVTYNYNNNNISTTKAIKLVIRQCGPEIINENDDTLCSANISLPDSNTTFNYVYSSTPSSTSSLILSYPNEQLFQVNMSSIETYTWACPENYHPALPSTTYTIYRYGDITNSSLIITSEQSTERVFGLTGKTKMMNVYLGYTQNLFLSVSNPWGSRVSKRFIFTKSSN